MPICGRKPILTITRHLRAPVSVAFLANAANWYQVLVVASVQPSCIGFTPAILCSCTQLYRKSVRWHLVCYEKHRLFCPPHISLRSVFFYFAPALLADFLIARFVYFVVSGAGNLTVQMQARLCSFDNSAAGTLHLRYRSYCTDMMLCTAVETAFPSVFSAGESAL